ncbi:MAG: DUF4197 domain-containing protein [Flavobacteriales bacterium]|nr:DUF4197 domain-containing protein [Flavobacteriales bacterium]
MKTKKKLLAILCAIVLTFNLTSCDELHRIGTEVIETATESTELSLTEIVNGLKEALTIGTGNAVGFLNKTDGYFKNPEVKIPFPPDAQRAADKLRELGMGSLVDNFVETLNHGAEDAAAAAKPIFVNAVKEMTFDDARKILSGPDNAATEYFKSKTRTVLFNSFTPKIKTSLDKVQVTKHWTQITSTYNKIPLVNKVETDLTKYATDKALDGLFLMVAKEEKKIRQDPLARVTDLLKKVFAQQ